MKPKRFGSACQLPKHARRGLKRYRAKQRYADIRKGRGLLRRLRLVLRRIFYLFT
jgi:hypothetical protein